MLKIVITVCGIVFLWGCATPPQTKEILNSSPAKSTHVLLSEVPFWPQTRYQCGPAALATVLNTTNVKVQPSQLVSQLYIPQKKGALTAEMVAATRQYQRIPVRVDGHLSQIFRQLDSGRPVVVLQNLGLQQIPKWHFAVVIGYDLDMAEFTLRSGEIEEWKTPFAVFERTWARGEYWAMIILSPDETPASKDLDHYLEAIVDFEEIGNHNIAKQGYQQILKLQPKQFTAHMGLGNLAYQGGDFQEAQKEFEFITLHYPDRADVWNNLAYVYAQQKLDQQARQSINKAIEISGSHSRYLQSQQEIEALIMSRKHAIGQ